MIRQYEDMFLLSDGDVGVAKIAPAPVYEDEEDFDIVFVDEHEMVDGDLPDEVKNKSKKALYEEMQQQQDSNKTIVETLGKNFEDLGNKIQQPKANPITQVPPQQPQAGKKTKAQIKADVDKKVWEGNFTDNLDPYLDSREEKLNEKFIALERQNFNLAAQVLSNDPVNKAILDDRQDEVNQMLMTYLPEHRYNPQVLTEVVNKIKQSDYAKDPSTNPATQALIDAAVAKALEDNGLKVEAKPLNNAPYTAGGGRVNPPSAKPQVKVPTWVREQAAQMGMDAKHYYRRLKEQGKI